MQKSEFTYDQNTGIDMLTDQQFVRLYAFHIWEIAITTHEVLRIYCACSKRFSDTIRGLIAFRSMSFYLE